MKNLIMVTLLSMLSFNAFAADCSFYISSSRLSSNGRAVETALTRKGYTATQNYKQAGFVVTEVSAYCQSGVNDTCTHAIATIAILDTSVAETYRFYGEDTDGLFTEARVSSAVSDAISNVPSCRGSRRAIETDSY